MLNIVTIQGRLTKDPDVRKTQSGLSVAAFSIACERDYGEAGAEKKTDFIDCVIWRQGADFIEKYFHKGDMILVTGRLQVRQWEDKDGNKRRTTEVLAEHAYFCGSRRNSVKPEEADGSRFEEMDDMDGGLPF